MLNGMTAGQDLRLGGAGLDNGRGQRVYEAFASLVCAPKISSSHLGRSGGASVSAPYRSAKSGEKTVTNMHKRAIGITFGTFFLLSCGAGSEVPDPSTALSEQPPEPVQLKLPQGFVATVFAEETFQNARHVAVNDNGDVYVKFRATKDKNGPGILALRDTDGDGQADVRESFSDFYGTGMALHNGFLYASSERAVYRYALESGELVPRSQPETIVSELPEQNAHKAKALAFDGQGHLYVNVGAPSNGCMEKARTAGSKGLDPCPQTEWQASVWRFRADQVGQTQRESGHRYAQGTRNMVALEWNTTVDSLFGVQHGRDQLNTLWPDHYDEAQNAELPAEEFFQISDGDDFGWPYCYYDHLQGKKLLAPEYGGDGHTEGRCGETKDPFLAFPAHLAPNDLIFYTGDQFPAHYRNGAFVAFRGSWNRAPLPQKGYFIAFVPFQDGQPSGDWTVFADGFSGLEEVAAPGDAAHRPCGLAQGPDGSLYVTETTKGTIWRISYTG